MACVETFAGQSDKECDFAQFLQFLESDVGQANCFHLIESVTEASDDEDKQNMYLRGRVNGFDIIVQNVDKANFPGGFGNKLERGLKSTFTPELARQKFMELVFKAHNMKEITDENRVALQFELQGWSAQAALESFLPGVQFDVTEVGRNTTVQVSLNRKTLAKASGASVHEAKHGAACKVLRAQGNMFMRSGDGKTKGWAEAGVACKDHSAHASLTKIGKNNPINARYGHDQSSGMVFAEFAVEKGAKTVDTSAKRVHDVLSNLSSKRRTKKQAVRARDDEAAARIKAGKEKFLSGNAFGVVKQLCQRLDLEMEVGFNDDKADTDLHRCTTTAGEFTVYSKDTTKKMAKTAAAQQLIPKIIKAYPHWYSGKKAEEAEAMEE